MSALSKSGVICWAAAIPESFGVVGSFRKEISELRFPYVVLRKGKSFCTKTAVPPASGCPPQDPLTAGNKTVGSLSEAGDAFSEAFDSFRLVFGIARLRATH